MALPLLQRELRLLARDAGSAAALAGLLAAMLAAGALLLVRVVEAPAGQVPAGESAASTLVGLHWVLCALLAPWALSRLGDGDGGDGTAAWGALGAVPPWRLAGARLGAAWLYMLQLLIVPLPLFLVVRSVAGVSSRSLLGALSELGCWLLLLAPALLLGRLAVRGTWRQLGFSYLIAGLLAAARQAAAANAGAGAVNALAVVAAAGLTLLLLVWSRRRLLYLEAR